MSCIFFIIANVQTARQLRNELYDRNYHSTKLFTNKSNVITYYKQQVIQYKNGDFTVTNKSYAIIYYRQRDAYVTSNTI